eukprot:CAMPEP_0198151764 /NCGR_PEP_ID=MMETSP1443-20131203/57000_1 /TAXON_ID=186043 /ORGANISM="Entomoneis sp., Strain CCMP2396" /LENGTH=244 /DNA_ID=CAMNT_0043817549 /DNA_START=114 /DNA_END=844 /DNA_ORIENTATION=+
MSIKMDTMQIHVLNNEGVNMLQTGSFIDAAIPKFRQALAFIHQGLHYGLPTKRGDSTNLSSARRQTVFTRYKTTRNDKESSASSLSSSPSKDDPFQISPHNCFQVFDAVFATHWLHPNDSCHEPETTIIVVYNYAYAMHRNGLLRGQTQYLKKALELYDMCLALCCTSQLAGRLTVPPTLKLAALANKLFLHGHFSNHEEVQDCYRQLQNTLDYAVSTPLLDEHDLVFFLNCLVICDNYIRRGA